MSNQRQLLAHGLRPAGPAGWVDRFHGQPRKGCDILVQALEREVGSGSGSGSSSGIFGNPEYCQQYQHSDDGGLAAV